jgi:acyl-CoA thioester hydrolase
VRYLGELHAGDPVRVTFQLLGYDKKRVHYFEQLIQTAENSVSATSENLALHVDMDAKRSALFPQSVLDRLEEMSDSHARLPRPAAAGRSIGMKGK